MEEDEQEFKTTSDESSYSDSDDSQADPTFSNVEKTRFNFSNLSIKSNNKRNEKDRADEQEDPKSYETVQKIIHVGNVEKLKVDQCKVYLRKHGLRLSGNKDVLIQRIKEHNDIVTGGGEEKYPASSFVLNCKGDACTGDVVIFEQNVYDMFNIASRSANGPPCGTRIVAGRIVKESYGAAKQQHTFTIEVLWSKGEKPLPPLHPLLIKGRNLYRLKTMRQKWEDEAEREKILAEKHARGGVARDSREARKKNKEARTLQRANRATTNKNSQRQKPQENQKTSCPASITTKPEKLIDHTKLEQKECEQMKDNYNRSREVNIQNQSVNMIEKLKSRQPTEPVHQRQPLHSVNRTFHDQSRSYSTNVHYPGTQAQMPNFNESQRCISARSPVRGFGHNVNGQNSRQNGTQMNGSKYSHPGTQPVLINSNENQRFSSARSPMRGFGHNYVNGQNGTQLNGSKYPHPGIQPQMNNSNENQRFVSARSPMRGSGRTGIQMNGTRFSHQSQTYHAQDNFTAGNNAPFQEKGYGRKQICRYYPQGMCHFGDRCKFLHE